MEMIYAAYGSDVADIEAVRQAAIKFEFEFEVREEGIIVWFDSTGQRAWFNRQI